MQQGWRLSWPTQPTPSQMSDPKVGEILCWLDFGD